ncbi:glycosyltransferase family 4 protein [Cupriavidus campinensis]
MNGTLPCVCFLTGTLNALAGAERMTAVIASALAERGYRVLVLSLWDRTSAFPLHPDVRHHALFDQRPSFKRHYVSTVLGIRHFMRAHDVNVLIEVDTMLTLFTLPATVGMMIRRIAWEHCHFDENLGRRARSLARRIAARTNDAVVVLTARDQQRWVSALRPHSDVHVIGNPLPFPFPAEVANADTRIVLAVGRLVPAKGFDILLQAWSAVVRSHPNWQLVIVGEGDARRALEAQRQALGLDDAVTFPGAITNVEAFYRNAEIFCLSSRYEGFGLVLVEAMAFGLPVLATDCETGPKEIIRDGENGILVAANNALALAAGIVRLIENDDLRNLLGTQGRKDARARDVTVIAGHWENLIHSSHF